MGRLQESPTLWVPQSIGIPVTDTARTGGNLTTSCSDTEAVTKYARWPLQFASKATALHSGSRTRAAAPGTSAPRPEDWVALGHGAGDPPPTIPEGDVDQERTPRPGLSTRAATNTPTRGWPPVRGEGQPIRAATRAAQARGFPARCWSSDSKAGGSQSCRVLLPTPPPALQLRYQISNPVLRT